MAVQRASRSGGACRLAAWAARAGAAPRRGLLLGLSLFGLALFGLSLLGGRARGDESAAPSLLDRGAPVALGLGTDQAAEVSLAPSSRLPLLGPRFAAVTLDLYIPVGYRGGENNLALALRLAREASDVRLVLHPVTSGPLAERGAEVIWEAFEQRPEACYPFITQLYNHPEWLAVSTDGEEALLAAAQTAGLDPQRLRRSLRRHLHRAAVGLLWQAMREQIRYPPELWVNGKRLRGALSELQLRDELDRQRTRAQRAVDGGAPLTQLYEQLVAQEATQRAEELTSVRRLFGAPPRLPSLTAPVHLQLDGAPSRGPRIAPVTVVLIGSIDSHESYDVARAAYELWSRHADSTRLVYLQAPRGESRERNAVQLAQLALSDEEHFWRVFTRVLELMPRVWTFDRYRLENLIRQEGGAAALVSISANLDEARRRVAQDLEQVRRIGIENTPMVLINGLPVHGLPLSEKLESALSREQQRGLLQRLHAPPPRVDYGWLER